MLHPQREPGQPLPSSGNASRTPHLPGYPPVSLADCLLVFSVAPRLPDFQPQGPGSVPAVLRRQHGGSWGEGGWGQTPGGRSHGSRREPSPTAVRHGAGPGLHGTLFSPSLRGPPSPFLLQRFEDDLVRLRGAERAQPSRELRGTGAGARHTWGYARGEHGLHTQFEWGISHMVQDTKNAHGSGKGNQHSRGPKVN